MTLSINWMDDCFIVHLSTFVNAIDTSIKRVFNIIFMLFENESQFQLFGTNIIRIDDDYIHQTFFSFSYKQNA